MILFDVIVPTYNRYSDLPRFFKENVALANHPQLLIWLIDDGSEKWSMDVLPNWNNIRFIRHETNMGQAQVRNDALAEGNAPFIISLDDDAWFEDATAALALIENHFATWTTTGCLMFNVATPSSSYSEIPTGKVLPIHVTCGCAYRRQTLKEIGGFSGFMHSGAEETDISLRMYREGWDIRFVKEVRVYHNFAPDSRSLPWLYRLRYNTTRNDLLIVLMYYPATAVPFFILGKYLSHMRHALFHTGSPLGSVWHTAVALGGFVGMAGQAIARRQPLSWKQLNSWRQLA